jgi:hypothetical protein
MIDRLPDCRLPKFDEHRVENGDRPYNTIGDVSCHRRHAGKKASEQRKRERAIERRRALDEARHLAASKFDDEPTCDPAIALSA